MVILRRVDARYRIRDCKKLRYFLRNYHNILNTSCHMNFHNNHTRKDFTTFAKNCQIPERTAKNMLAKLCSLKDAFLLQCDESYLSGVQKTGLKDLIEERIAIINK